MTENRILYGAYGMNTNKREMAIRCPDAQFVGRGVLEDFLFRFAYHADVVESTGHTVELAVWSITQQCERSLDTLEGFPNYYHKIQVPVTIDYDVKQVMVYQMTPGNLDGLPSDRYLNCLIEGYNTYGLDLRQISTAIKNIN